MSKHPKNQYREKFWEFCDDFQNHGYYLPIEELKNNHSYKILERNAYVGIWYSDDNGFWISRYKGSEKPWLFIEYHWDTGEPTGTVKPIEHIERSPFSLPQQIDSGITTVDTVTQYLDKLEIQNPLIPGWNSLEDRKKSTLEFMERLRTKRLTGIPVHKIRQNLRKKQKE